MLCGTAASLRALLRSRATAIRLLDCNTHVVLRQGLSDGGLQCGLDIRCGPGLLAHKHLHGADVDEAERLAPIRAPEGVEPQAKAAYQVRVPRDADLSSGGDDLQGRNTDATTLYVAISRFRRADHLLILQPFDIEVLQQGEPAQAAFLLEHLELMAAQNQDEA